MLQTIRDRASGVIAWIIIIGVTIPFAVWGINQYFSGASEVVVAKVDGDKILQRDLNRAVQQQRDQLRQRLGKFYRPDMIDEAKLKQQVLDGMIDREVLLGAAHDLGFAIGNKALAVRLHSIPAFQENGEFSKARYEAVMRNQGLNPLAFEADERSSMILTELVNGVADSVLVSSHDVDELLRLQGQRRQLSYQVVDAKQFADAVKVDEKAVAAYYAAHKQEFMTPEQVNVAYLRLRLQDLAKNEKVDDAKLQQAYQEQKKSFTLPEQREVSHILIDVPADADKQAVEEARNRADALLAKLKAGASFAALAKADSQDQGSAAKGGLLGVYTEKTLASSGFNPAIAKAVFAAKQGELVGPVRSSFGFHIIRVDTIRPGGLRPFAEVRDQLLASVRRDEAESQFYDKSNTLANVTYEHPDTLQPAADALGLKVQENGWMSRQGGGTLPANPKIIEAAFSDEVLNQHQNSLVLELGPTDDVVLRVIGHKAPAQQPLAEVHDKIVDLLRLQAMRDQAQKRADAMLAALQAGKAAEQTATTGPLWIGRNDQKQPAALVQAVFKMPRPAAGKPQHQVVALPNDRFAVVTVDAVRDGDPKKASADERKRAEEALRGARGQNEFEALRKSLRNAADVSIDQAKL